MANINTPAHDFAPPWLKIPSYDSNRPSGAEGDRGRHASRKEGHSFGSSRHTKDSDNFAPSRHHFYHDNRRERNNFSSERKPSHFSYHHSLEIDEPYFDGHCGPSTYNTNFSCNGTLNSQSLLRRPHSRHDFRNIPASYAKGDIYNRHVNNSSGGFYGKAKSKFSDANAHNSNSIFNGNGGINACSNNFNQEFPSLQGDIAEEPTSPAPLKKDSVWEKHRNMTVQGSGVGKKIQLIKKPFTSDCNGESNKKIASLSLPSSGSAVSSSCSPSSIANQHTVTITSVAKGGSGIYRAFIPTKSNNTSKKSILTKEVSAKLQSLPKKQPNSVCIASPHSMEILVKHPKAPGNKSDFLKALRNESNGSNSERKDLQENCTSEDTGNGSESSDEKPHTNGIDIAKLSVNDNNERPLLSSSLEAEQRLLREMGWKEDASDDDNYAPLTEDEMREFRKLTEQIPKKNGFRRNLQTNFSPRRLTPFSNITLPTDPCSSSSGSDSDSDF